MFVVPGVSRYELLDYIQLPKIHQREQQSVPIRFPHSAGVVELFIQEVLSPTTVVDVIDSNGAHSSRTPSGSVFAGSAVFSVDGLVISTGTVRGGFDKEQHLSFGYIQWNDDKQLILQPLRHFAKFRRMDKQGTGSNVLSLKTCCSLSSPQRRG
jgi:hypothetical protein